MSLDNKSSENNLAAGFLKSSNKFPERDALVVNNQTYSYKQLSQMSCFLKHQIENLVQEAAHPIGLLAYRSSTAYAGILAVLAAGFGYVPMLPDYPAERNLKILTQAGSDVVIVGAECLEALSGLLQIVEKKMTFVLVGASDDGSYSRKYPLHHFLFINKLEIESPELLQINPVQGDQLAYILFTSGSTGEPKGVTVAHQNVRSYVKYVSEHYDINEFDRCSQLHDMTFDFSVHDIFPAWEKGACVCVASSEEKFYPVGFMNRCKITSWSCVPSVAIIIDKYNRLTSGAFPNLRYTFFGGEALNVSTVEKWQRAAPNAKVINIYGPTETTIAVSMYHWDSQNSPAESLNGIVPLGHMINNQKGLIVNEEGQECAVNQPGELYLSGAQVSIGYWKSPTLTKDRFVRLKETGEAIWYRTGDLVKKDKNGKLDYLGRIDNQVKILGNRIELSEIDLALREACEVEHAVAVPYKDESGNTVGVIAFVSGTKKEPQYILDYCRKKLPKYLVPKEIRYVDALPLNNNGKIDRLQLQNLLLQAQTPLLP